MDKAMITMPDGRPLLAHLLDVPARRRIVVGPRRPVIGVDVWAREQPPGSGPVAALAAGLPFTTGRLVVTLAGDTPAAADAVPALVAGLGAADVAVLVADGRRQHLLAVWRRPALAAALAGVPEGTAPPVHRLMEGACVVEVADRAQWSRDIDTPQDLATMTDQPALGQQGPLGDWLAEAATALDLDPSVVDVGAVLDLARDCAHDVARPAAPLTTFLAGLAAGRAGGDPTAVRDAIERVMAALRQRSAG